MNSKKKVYFANFNVTFGQNNEPLLDYFESIVYPALTSGLVREYGGSSFTGQEPDKYFFENVKLIQTEDGRYALTGLFIHKTIIDILSEHDEEQGIISTDKHYPSAPYSTFLLFLDNHRCVLVKNQKSSPDIRSFNTTVRHIFDIYIKEYNRGKAKKDRLPSAFVNIISLPSESGIVESLAHVHKISKLHLKFYPLNGEIATIPSCMNALREQLGSIGSQAGVLSFTAPDNISNVIEMLKDTEGTVEPVAIVKYKSGGKGTLTSENFSQNTELDLNTSTGDIDQDSANIFEGVKQFPELKKISEENKSIYSRNLDKIIRFFK